MNESVKKMRVRKAGENRVERGQLLVLFAEYCHKDEIKEDKIGGTCGKQ